jgi:hypothetical protein
MALETVGSLQLVPVVCSVDVVDMALLPQTTRTNQSSQSSGSIPIAENAGSRTEVEAEQTEREVRELLNVVALSYHITETRCFQDASKSDMQQSEYPRCRDRTHGHLGTKLKMSGFG